MKYFFCTITILLILIGAGYTHAQTDSPTPNQINGVTTQSTAPVNTTSNNAALGTLPVATSTANAVNTCAAIQFTSLLNIAVWVKCLIGAIVIPGIFSIAFVIFLWGIVKFMRSSDQKDKQDAKQYIFSGLIGLFVMVSVWGIVRILTTTFGISTVVPTLQGNALPSTTTPTTTTTGSN